MFFWRLQGYKGGFHDISNGTSGTPWKINMEHVLMEVWKIIFLSKWLICRFHVNLPGCTHRTFNFTFLDLCHPLPLCRSAGGSAGRLEFGVGEWTFGAPKRAFGHGYKPETVDDDDDDGGGGGGEMVVVMMRIRMKRRTIITMRM